MPQDATTQWGIPVDSPTEERNPRTTELDSVTTLELVRLINDEDQQVPTVVAAALPRIADLVDAAAQRVAAGGRVHYVGAGTSGRLGVVDAAELLPTFNLEPGVVVAHLAGGPDAIVHAQENVEDDEAAGSRALEDVTAEDVVVGLAASGRTPYVLGALRLARSRGAVTALVTSNPRARALAEVDHAIVLETGPEALTGSTRMKSASAQKLALHTFSTALMVCLGRTWSNLMVSMVATNEKLRARTVTVLHQATGLPAGECQAALQAAGGELKVALVMLLTAGSAPQARHLLSQTDGIVRAAVAALTPDPHLAAPTVAGGATDNRHERNP